MAFYKTFPRTTDKSAYPVWEEIKLEDSEEKEEERIARKEYFFLMKECIDDAKKIMDEKALKAFQTDQINIAIALFEKRASHEVYYKERKAKEKFEKRFPSP